MSRSNWAFDIWTVLTRRRIVQWSLAYVAVAWGLLQGIAFAVETFSWPEAVTRGAAVAAAFGLAIVAVLAWYHGNAGRQRFTRVEMLILVLLACGGLIGSWHAARTVPRAGETVAIDQPEASVTRFDARRLAVLPFSNLSQDASGADFVNGVHDTLITQIARIPGLSVISRTSVLRYADEKPNIRDVAAALRVGSVLEGSVYRSGDRIRVNAQLIDGNTDAHLWAETFDRPADDLFAVQSEIALAVAQRLRIQLSADDSQHLRAALTSNPRAYERFMLAQVRYRALDLQGALEGYSAAVTIDPSFATAYAQRSIARTWKAYHKPGSDRELVELAEADVDRAIALDPTLPAAHLAKAVFHYRGKQDIERAASEFELALAGMPNDSDAHVNFGYLRRWQGRLDEALALFQHAAELDPGGDGPSESARLLVALGRRAEADAMLEKARVAAPDNPAPFITRAGIAASVDCDLGAAERIMDEAVALFPDDDWVRHQRRLKAIDAGDYETALRISDWLLALPSGPEWEAGSFDRGVTLLKLGRGDEARRVLQKSREGSLQNALENSASGAAGNEFAMAAVASALLGDRRSTIEYVDRAQALLPTMGAWNRLEVLRDSAAALAQIGENTRAIELLRAERADPSPISATGLWCDWLLAPLRKDPRFRELVEAHGGNTAIDPLDRRTWPNAPSTTASVTGGR